jgi:hypothetical protein
MLFFIFATGCFNSKILYLNNMESKRGIFTIHSQIQVPAD